VVAITPGYRRSKQKRHVVKHIIAPSGTPIEARPPIPTEEERWAADTAKKAAKDSRRAAQQDANPAAPGSAKESNSGEVEPTNSHVD
jgi:small subunit ribosomal protein S17